MSDVKDKNKTEERSHYIWVRGVLRWGVPMAIIFSVVTLISSLLSPNYDRV
jgi:hypothetical protein